MKLLKPLEIEIQYWDDDEDDDPNASLYVELGIKDSKSIVPRKATIFSIENFYPSTSKKDSLVIVTSGGISMELTITYNEFKQLIKNYI